MADTAPVPPPPAAPDERYMARGVSAAKEDVHTAIANVDKGLFPRAFCKVVPDIAGDPEWCTCMHADGAGTKSSLAYMYWKETGDLSVWRGIAQDSVIMNIDDLLCIGCVDNILLSSTIGRNKNVIPGEVLSALIAGTEHVLQTLRDAGVGVFVDHDTSKEVKHIGNFEFGNEHAEAHMEIVAAEVVSADEDGVVTVAVVEAVEAEAAVLVLVPKWLLNPTIASLVSSL
jgi:phosphoribosylformylglycinamidine cyclo-ligase